MKIFPTKPVVAHKLNETSNLKYSIQFYPNNIKRQYEYEQFIRNLLRENYKQTKFTEFFQ